jgi:4'-phosphopantetheinyl transferase EntD
MPLFFQQEVNEHTRLAIWKIVEDEPFFDVPLQRSITHPHKRLQHLAGRYLLRYLFPEFPLSLIQIADTRKPYLEDELFHFSISHCSDFAAVIVSKKNRVGVDIETLSEKIQRIQHKFISDMEMQVLNDNLQRPAGYVMGSAQLTLIWSCKEAVFKWYGLGNVDFKSHIEGQGMQTMEGKLFQIPICFKKEAEQRLLLQSRMFDDLCLSYVVT